MGRKLNQVIAAEAQARAATSGKIGQLAALSGRSELYNGLTKTYTPLNESDPDSLPPDEKKAQMLVSEQLRLAREAWADLFDLTFVKDSGNCNAKADVKIDGKTVLSDVPVTYLLWLEKQMGQILLFCRALPQLDEAHDWTEGANGLYRSNKVKTHRTKKVQRPIVMYDATPEHPAQTQLITEDIVVGHYETQYVSGAMPFPRLRALVTRIERALRAVKEAREEANTQEVVNRTAEPLLDYLFNGTEQAQQ